VAVDGAIVMVAVVPVFLFGPTSSLLSSGFTVDSSVAQESNCSTKWQAIPEIQPKEDDDSGEDDDVVVDTADKDRQAT